MAPPRLPDASGTASSTRCAARPAGGAESSRRSTSIRRAAAPADAARASARSAAAARVASLRAAGTSPRRAPRASSAARSGLLRRGGRRRRSPARGRGLRPRCARSCFLRLPHLVDGDHVEALLAPLLAFGSSSWARSSTCTSGCWPLAMRVQVRQTPHGPSGSRSDGHNKAAVKPVRSPCSCRPRAPLRPGSRAATRGARHARATLQRFALAERRGEAQRAATASTSTAAGLAAALAHPASAHDSHPASCRRSSCCTIANGRDASTTDAPAAPAASRGRGSLGAPVRGSRRRALRCGPGATPAAWRDVGAARRARTPRPAGRRRARAASGRTPSRRRRPGRRRRAPGRRPSTGSRVRRPRSAALAGPARPCATSSARAAENSSASVTGCSSPVAGDSSSCRSASPTGVDPGSRTCSAACPAACSHAPARPPANSCRSRPDRRAARRGSRDRLEQLRSSGDLASSSCSDSAM
jgi:hypothetical protein